MNGQIRPEGNSLFSSFLVGLWWHGGKKYDLMPAALNRRRHCMHCWNSCPDRTCAMSACYITAKDSRTISSGRHVRSALCLTMNEMLEIVSYRSYALLDRSESSSRFVPFLASWHMNESLPRRARLVASKLKFASFGWGPSKALLLDSLESSMQR